MSLDEYIRGLLNLSPQRNDSPTSGRRPRDDAGSESPPFQRGATHDWHGRDRLDGFIDLDRIISSFFGGGSQNPAIGNDSDPSSYGSTEGGWSGPRIQIWSWQDTRDEFGDDDRGGGSNGVFEWDGGGMLGDGGDDDDDGNLFPPEIRDGNDNWHSDSDGMDVFRGFFGGGFDDLFRLLRPPGGDDFEHNHDDERDDDDSMMRPASRKSIRDYMLKAPINDSPVTDIDTPPKETPAPPPAPSLIPKEELRKRGDATLDFKSDDEKTREIERILSSQKSDGDNNEDGGGRNYWDKDDSHARRPHASSTPSWGTIFPRHFWNGWFFGGGGGGGVGGGNGVGGGSDPRISETPRDDADDWLGSVGDTPQRRDHSWNWGGNSFSSSFSYRSTSTSTTVQPDGTVETKKTEKDGKGNVTETVTRKRGNRMGTVVRMMAASGAETVEKKGDQSLF